MPETLTPKQALLVWRLITAETPEEREPKKSSTRPRLSKQEFSALEESGLVVLEKRKRPSKPKSGKTKSGKPFKPRMVSASYVTLTDQAWAWAAAAVDVEVLKSNSSVGAFALQGLLRRMLPYLLREDIALAELFTGETDGDTAERPDPVDAVPPEGPVQELRSDSTPTPAPADLGTQIEQACLKLAAGQRQTRIRLADLRSQMSQTERRELDTSLLALQDAGRLVLYREDNSAALTAEDHAAALLVGNAPRHLVLLEA